MSKKRRNDLARKMARAFLAAGPLGPADPEEGAELVRRMLRTVKRQFPEATLADGDAMIREVVRLRDKGPSWERLGRAAVCVILEELATEVLEQEVKEGKSAREIDPQTGETVYRRVGKAK
jgi:hypothetical protein